MNLSFRQDPVKLGLTFTTWTFCTVAAFCHDLLNLNWTYQQVWNYLKQVGMRYRKIETQFLNKPVEYDLWKVTKHLLDRFLCWTEEPQRIDLKQPIHGKLHLLGAFAPQVK